MDVKEEIKSLTEKLNYYSSKYYEDDSPEISDYEYDMLLRKLVELENKYPEYALLNSPTKKVGGARNEKFSPVTHEVKMESLQDAFSYEELYSFEKRVLEKANKKVVFSFEPKIDGLSVSLEYRNGSLYRASTRGDGVVGEDVTDNIKTIKSIPKKIEFDDYLEVRGEVYMSKDNFLNLVARQEDEGLKPAKNPRNAAAGSLRQKNPEITAERELSCYVFNVQQIENKTFDSHIQSLDFLKKLGFSVLPFYKKVENIDQAIIEIEELGDHRGKLDCDIDGAVIKVDDLNLRSILGSTSKSPRWAVAYKYPPEEKETEIINIEINVGRTGALTPVAVFKPITLAGTTVSRAVLHNSDFIKEKNINIKDTIVVRKAGEIIPEVVSLAKKGENSGCFAFPDTCPSCGSKVFREDNAAAIRCLNTDCPAQIARNIIHFASRDAMDIEGLGPAVVYVLLEKGIIKNVADLYKINASSISSLDRFGEKSADNLINSINNSKNNDLSDLIFALGIRHIGNKAAKLLANRFKNIDNIFNASISDIEDVEGFGKIMAESVYDYFQLEATKNLIDELKSLGLNMVSKNVTSGNLLSGKTFVLTGTLPNLKRNEAKKIIEENGGNVSSSVSKNTSFVLAGEEPGSKYTKAVELNIKIISEDDLFNMIN